jgi:glycosyltransferase involved in cell wall biosynthesis
VRTGHVRPQHDRAPIVSWAAGDPVGYPGEADFVMKVMGLVSAQRAGTIFRLYGDDGSDAYAALVERYRAAGIAIETRPSMAYDAFLQSLEEVAVGLNPLIAMDGFSAGKSFGKVLAYLDAGVPTINTPNVDHPLFFEHGRNGFLAGEDVNLWADLVLSVIDDAAKRGQIAEAARLDLLERLSLSAAGCRVDETLRSAIAATNGTA